jgi:zinc transporter ZupT
MAEDRGWGATLAGVSGILLLLGLLDRYVYPICPFCAAGVHGHVRDNRADANLDANGLGRPLLAVACLHNFFDGWTIAVFHVASLSHSLAALSWGATIHKIPESVAIGLLAARFSSSRRKALGAVLSIQAAMATGGVLAVWSGRLDSRWAEISAMPACALLLLIGLLTLHQEWRLNGRLSAMRAVAPGLLGCGLAALARTILSR